MKKRLILLAAIGVLGTSSVLFASSNTDADDYSGWMKEYHSQRVKENKDILDQRVKDGKLTQDEADAIYDSMINGGGHCGGYGRMNGYRDGRGMMDSSSMRGMMSGSRMGSRGMMWQ